MTNLIPTVTIVGGQPRVSSLDIAEKFGKRHDDALRAIKRILSRLDEDFRLRNFAETLQVNEQNGQKYPAYSLTRDGFSLLAMGFTGKAALAWKVKYIEAFNAMEAELLNKAKPSPRQRRPRKALPAPEQLALPTRDPVQEEIEALLKRVEFYTREVDLAGEEIAKIMARESLNESRTQPGRIGNPYYDFHLDTATSVRFLFSSINFNLNAVRDTIRIRRTYGI